LHLNKANDTSIISTVAHVVYLPVVYETFLKFVLLNKKVDSCHVRKLVRKKRNRSIAETSNHNNDNKKSFLTRTRAKGRSRRGAHRVRGILSDEGRGRQIHQITLPPGGRRRVDRVSPIAFFAL